MTEALGQAWRFFRGWLCEGAPRRDAAEVADIYAALALTLAATVLAFGTQHLPILVGVTAATTATTVVALRRSGSRIGTVALVLFGLAAWSAFQACPLPLGLLRFLTPKTAEIWSRAYELTETGRRTASISLDPGGSLVEAVKWTTYGSVAVISGLLTKRLGVRPIAGLVLCLATLVAVITLAHGLIGATTVYGFYVPTFHPGPWGMGPLLNSNNRSGYLNLGALAGLGLLASRGYKGPRWLVAMGVGLVVAMSVLARSRGGLAALSVGFMGVLFMLLRRALSHHRSQRSFYLRTALAPLAALVGGLALAAIGGDGQMWAKIRKENLEKLHIASWTGSMLADFPIFGVGRGAFGSVFPAYRKNGDNLVYVHAENFLTDWATEWGMVFAIPALAMIAWSVRPERDEESPKAVLRLALVVLLVQNLVDHALETPAIAMLGAAIAAALASGRERSNSTERRFRPTALALGAFALVIAALLWGRHSMASDRAVLSARVGSLKADEPETFPATLSDIRDAVRRHPADPFIPLLGAWTARRIPNSRPMRWLGWALERDMMSGHTHLLVAYFLQRGGVTKQALLELRVAAQNDPNLRTRAAQWAVLIAREPQDAKEVVLSGAAGAPMLLVMAKSPRFASTRFALMEEAAARDPSLDAAHSMAAYAYIDALAHRDDPTCQPANLAYCMRLANGHIVALEHLRPDRSTAVELGARLLDATGRPDEARKLLSERCAAFPSAAGCWRLRVLLGKTEVAGPEYTQALRAYYSMACTTSPTCINAAKFLGGVLRGRSDYLGALSYYAKAVESGDNSASVWLAIAGVARSAGQPRRATEALKNAQKASKGDPEMKQRVDQAIRGILPAALKEESTPPAEPVAD